MSHTIKNFSGAWKKEKAVCTSCRGINTYWLAKRKRMAYCRDCKEDFKDVMRSTWHGKEVVEDE